MADAPEGRCADKECPWGGTCLHREAAGDVVSFGRNPGAKKCRWYEWRGAPMDEPLPNLQMC